MKKILIFSLSAILCCSLAFTACAQQPGEQTAEGAGQDAAIQSAQPADNTNVAMSESTITVNTTESVDATPDLAYVYLGVQTKGASADEAQQQNATQAQALIDALKKQGVANEDIETSNINIYQDWEDSTQYVMDNTFKVTIRNVDHVGSTLDAAIQAGANSSYSLSFDISNRDEVYAEALGKAMTSVNAKAQTVAKAGGYSIVRPQSIQEGGTSSYYAEPMMEMAADDSAASVSTPVSPGTIEVSASVTGTYVIE